MSSTHKTNLTDLQFVVLLDKEATKEYFAFVEELEEISKSAKKSFDYASKNGRFPQGEEAILESFKHCKSYAYEYAKSVIKGRWKEFEDIILEFVSKGSKPEYGVTEIVFEYVRDVVKKEWKEVEPLFASYPNFSFSYALYILKGRFEKGEPAISQNANFAYQYARKVIKGKLPEDMHRQMLAHAIGE